MPAHIGFRIEVQRNQKPIDTLSKKWESKAEGRWLGGGETESGQYIIVGWIQRWPER